MQGILLESHLAYLSGRTYVPSVHPLPVLRLNLSPLVVLVSSPGRYVFQNYTWEPTDGDFAYYKDNRIPARVPLTALLSGMLPPFHSLCCLHTFSFIPRQALLLGIHFHHPPVARLQSWRSTLRKYARTPPSSIRTS